MDRYGSAVGGASPDETGTLNIERYTGEVHNDIKIYQCIGLGRLGLCCYIDSRRGEG